MLGPSLLAPKTQAMLAPLIDKLAFVEAINDAWALVALLTLAVMVAVPLARTPIWRTDRDDPPGPRHRPPAAPLTAARFRSARHLWELAIRRASAHTANDP